MFTHSKGSFDPLQAIELDKQRSKPCNNNETKEQRSKREAKGDLDAIIQSSLDLRVGLIVVRRGRFLDGRVNFWDIVAGIFL